MSYEFYKILHVFSALLLMTSLGVLAAALSPADRLRRLAGVAHGIALVLLLVAGFGLAARLQMFGNLPLWVYLKIGLWLLFGLAVVPLRRKPEWSLGIWVLLPVMASIAAWLAISKPF